MKRSGLAVWGLAVATLGGSPAWAQDPAPGANTAIYDPKSFPDARSAEDILRRIPGVQAIIDASGDVQQRGFGSGGAMILVGGKRFPGKSNEIIANLRRISAVNVVRVELISGASVDVRVQSQGMVVNIVLRDGASVGGVGSYELNGRFNDLGWFGLDGMAAYTRAFGGLTVSGGIERNLWSPATTLGATVRWTDRTRQEVYYNPDGSVQELRPQEWQRRHDKWSFNGALSYAFGNGDALNVNGLYERREIVERDETRLTRFREGVETLSATERHQRRFIPYQVRELSVEYAAALGPGAFNGLFIYRRESNPAVDIRTREEPTRIIEVSQSDGLTKVGEDIARGSYVFDLPGGQKLELGVEGARNTLLQNLDVFFDFDGDGRLEPATLPIADPKVRELRAEAFANFKWQVSDRLSLDSALNYESSRLTTNYPLQPARQLGFLKPRLDVRYRITPRSQFRFLVERKVSQLDFNNFVPRYNFVDDRVEAGNPELSPEKTWAFQVGYERRLAGGAGLIDVRAFYDDITDAIERTPLVQGGFLVSAAGNIPKAKFYGVEAKFSFPLRALGLPAAQLNLRALRQGSRIKDPFTGVSRRLNDDRRYAYDIGFRHDVRSWAFSYGFDYRNTGLAAINPDLLVTEYSTVDPVLAAFVERALSARAIIRLELQNLTHSPERKWRELYLVNRIDGRLRRADFFEERRDIRGTLKLRGQF